MAAYTGGAGIPVYPDYGEVARSMIAAEELNREKRAEAIRWQGAQEYDTLIKSGVAPQEAFTRTAPKLFYNEPRALAGSAPNIGKQPGQFWTNPETGQEFIIQPNQTIQQVKPKWWGSTRIVGPNNQTFNVPLTPGQYQAAPTTSMPPTPPQVVPMPGGGPGQMIVQPGGVGRPYQDPTKIVKIYDKETGTYVQMTTAEHALKLARDAAKPLLDEYAKNKAEVQTEKVGWDWWPWNETFQERQKAIADTLAAQGLDPEGEPIPGSALAKKMGLDEQPAPEATQATPPPAAATPPVAPAPTAPAPTLTPRQAMQLQMWQRRNALIGGPGQPANIMAPGQGRPVNIMAPGAAPPVTAPAPPVAPAPTPAPAAPRQPRPNVPLASTEVLVETIYGWAIYDTKLKKFVDYADNRPTR